jgi:hypothetical protein
MENQISKDNVYTRPIDDELMTGTFNNNITGVSDTNYATFDSSIKGLIMDSEPNIKMEKSVDKLGCECYYFSSDDCSMMETLSRNTISPKRYMLCKVFKLNKMYLIQMGKSIMPLYKFLDIVEIKIDKESKLLNCITKDNINISLDIHFDYIINILITLTNIYRNEQEKQKVETENDKQDVERVTMLGQV